MLFRAVPIAAGVLIGQRYNMRFTGLMVAMVVQALILVQDMQLSRTTIICEVVELFLPSIVVYGMIYLRLGVVLELLLTMYMMLYYFHYQFGILQDTFLTSL